MTTQQRALELTDWLGHNEIHQTDPAALLAVVRSYLMAEHVAALREAAEIAETAYDRMFPKPGNRIIAQNAGWAVARVIRALAEERSVG